MTIIKTPKIHMPQTHHPTIAKTPKELITPNSSSYHSQNAQTSQQSHVYQTPKQPFQHFPNESFTLISPFNLPCQTPVTSSTHPNYSSTDRKLSYDNVSLHTQDFLEIQELFRNFGDIPETSNLQTPEMNQQRMQQIG